MADALAATQRMFGKPGTRFVGVGFSMGSNMLLRYAGDHPTTHPFAALVSIANGFDVGAGTQALSAADPLADELAASFIRELTDNHPRVAKEAKRMYRRCKSFQSMDTAVMHQVYGSQFDMHAYYKAISCIANVDKIAVPILAIGARDDPFIAGVVDRYSEAVRCNPQ